MPGVSLRALTMRYGDRGRRREPVAGDQTRGAAGAARPVGLRQDDDAAAGGRLPHARRRGDLGRRSLPVVVDVRRAARAAADGDDLPELRAVAAHDGGAERGLRAALQVRPRARRARPPRGGDAARRPARGLRGRATRGSCRAASSSAWPWRARWWSSRRSCCSTSRCRTSTPTCARRCASRSAGCTRRSRITTLYVTHDQAEAMVISDRIAVLQQRPRRPGGDGRRGVPAAAHALRGRVHRQDEPDRRRRRRGARPWRTARCACASGGGGLVAGARVAVSIRPHDIALTAAGDARARRQRAARHRAARQLPGRRVDYEVRGRRQRRGAARGGAGDAAWARGRCASASSIDPAACVALAAPEDRAMTAAARPLDGIRVLELAQLHAINPRLVHGAHHGVRPDGAAARDRATRRSARRSAVPGSSAARPTGGRRARRPSIPTT